MATHRILWLLNQTTLRRFELVQFESLGINEVFTPKRFQYDEGNLSADVNYSLDARLTISQGELKILNEQDWYSSATAQAWEIANRHFDVAVIGFFPEQLKSAVRHFKGAIVLRAFGLSGGYSYSQLIYQFGGERLVRDIKALGRRFWFGAAYQHLYQVESRFLRDRNCFLPVGLAVRNTSADWTGTRQRILFICPRIGSSPYYEKVYKDFLKAFFEFPYTIGGAQPVAVEDPNVIGFVSRDDHERHMREHRVMFYHSQEKNHIHYHPFEAVAAGMPLVFMAGGMLDNLGGASLPGRCESVDEARNKIKRILAGDEQLIRSIRSSQVILLDAVKAENCAPVWQSSFQRVLTELEQVRAEVVLRPMSPPSKVAVILPVAYKGGTLRGAELIAEAIQVGSREAGEPAEVVFAHLDVGDYSENDFADLPSGIKRRPFISREVDAAEARRAMRYAGHDDWEPSSERYLILDDGIRQFVDCDLWLILSDRLYPSILPLRPIALMVNDYLQRYVPILTKGADQTFIDAARIVERVFVTTDFTRQDALQYGGVSPQKLVKLPMLIPRFHQERRDADTAEPDYFIWATNAAPHKNRQNAFRALDIYYGELGGGLRCVITGVNTDTFLSSSIPDLRPEMAGLKSNKRVLRRLTFSGYLTDDGYRRLLSGAAFLWHPARIDNDTFSVIEAASLGVPALSSDYPAMREINEQFRLGLSWMDADAPRSMAKALKEMECHWKALRKKLPTPEELASQDVKRLAGGYWKAIRECL
jgi:glycosyltransferase involved in cell wall biosynthesis